MRAGCWCLVVPKVFPGLDQKAVLAYTLIETSTVHMRALTAWHVFLYTYVKTSSFVLATHNMMHVVCSFLQLLLHIRELLVILGFKLVPEIVL